MTTGIKVAIAAYKALDSLEQTEFLNEILKPKPRKKTIEEKYDIEEMAKRYLANHRRKNGIPVGDLTLPIKFKPKK